MPVKSAKIPMRMCIGCREMKPKKELIRIVQPKEGEMATDPTGKKNGRGAYVCANLDCLHAAQKSKALRIPPHIVEQLEQEIARRG